MTRVVVTSDLHLGITDEPTLRAHAAAIAAEAPDLTVLAGDIAEGYTRFQRCLNIFRELPGAVAVLVGNHDVWAREYHNSQDLWERLLPRATEKAGMLWLEDTAWTRAGLAVIGSVAWYDYSAAAPGLDHDEIFWRAHKKRWIADAQFINWPWSDPEFATQVGDRLVQRVAAQEADPDVTAILVVTHVPLFEEQMLRLPHDQQWTYGNTYFGNLTLGKRLLSAHKLRGVISGHTHIQRDARCIRADGDPVRLWVIKSDYRQPGYALFDYPEPG
jgi:predicted phosphohydrolase